MKKTYPHKCKLCKYKWGARVEHPKSCPQCKQYHGVQPDK